MSYTAIYVPIIMYCLRLFIENYIVYRNVTFLFRGRYGHLSVCKSFVSQLCLVIEIFLPFCEDGFRIECLLPRKCGFSECMGAMLANPHDPHIQRGYRPFVIHSVVIHGECSEHFQLSVCLFVTRDHIVF